MGWEIASGVRQHAHTPFIIRTPDGDNGRSDIFEPPQDILGAVMGLAGVELPEEAGAHDVVERLWDWLRSNGESDFPRDARLTDAHPAPARCGWRCCQGTIQRRSHRH